MAGLSSSPSSFTISPNSERLRQFIRASDTLARLGGDEFALLQGGVVQPGDVEMMSDKLLAAFTEPFDLVGQHRHRRLSGGWR